MAINWFKPRRHDPVIMRMLRGYQLGLVALLVLLSGCSQIERPTPEPFFAKTTPPSVQEFRWSNGKMPKSFDPARAAAAPETSIVRTLYEGLTDIDAKTLKEIPGVAERWESSSDLKTWTFHLRKDARWSNGQPVLAEEFVNSWKRLVNLREKAANPFLFQNIVGMRDQPAASETHPAEPTDFLHETPADPRPQAARSPNANAASKTPSQTGLDTSEQKKGEAIRDKSKDGSKTQPVFGVVAIDDRTLTVTLEVPDKDLPKLVANPIFRPIYGDGVEFEDDGLDSQLVTNGPFRIKGIAADGISLERSDTYWNRKAVTLERVRFVPMDSAEKALEAYRTGVVDAVTNSNFEPLTLKLLSPYEDFRRTVHGALNFYEFNPAIPPFSDRRVREALAISIDRDRLAEGELEGSSQPAYSFLPFGGTPNKSSFLYDTARAKDILEKAGYPNGANFPIIRLVINRNETQQRIAKTVARMWKQNLNIDTQVITKELSEMEAVRSSGDFDLIRRGAVMPTMDEQVNLSSIIAKSVHPEEENAKAGKNDERPGEPHTQKTPAGPEPKTEGPVAGTTPGMTVAGKPAPQPKPTMSEQEAIYDVYAIPLYFPTSYSLVKPYVRGFDMNGLDSPSLKDVMIDSSWQP